jgi:alkaline phosphatase
MKHILIVIFAFFYFVSCLVAQNNYQNARANDSLRVFVNNDFYDVTYYEEPISDLPPKNIIIIIGDGMGVSQVHGALTANKGVLFLNNFKNIGFQTTYSATNYITDSAAAGTALASGQKTYDAGIGVDMDTIAIPNIRAELERAGWATGVVSTSAVTHATPAAFVAHQASRNSYEAIAADFLKTNIDVFIGGGYNHFAKREDGQDLIAELKKKDYQVLTNINDVAKVKRGKLAGLVADVHPSSVLDGRGNMLEVATETAINILSNNKKGFFLMVEGSQIDWGGHANSTPYTISETLDMDKAVGKAIAFAAKNKETLVIVTADHETGGMAIIGGDPKTGRVVGGFVSGNHTAVLVPVFAFGPGSEMFRGIYDNTDIPKKLMELLGK